MHLRIAFALALNVAATAAAPAADAAGGKTVRTPSALSNAAITTSPSGHRRDSRTNCTPYNGPYGYYGNPWCEGGYFWTEDRPLQWDGRYARHR